MKMRFSFLMAILFSLLWQFSAFSGQQPQSSLLSQLSSPTVDPQLGRQITSSLAAQENFLLEGLRDHLVTQKLRQQMQTMARPEILAPLFVKNLQELSAYGAKTVKVRDYLQSLRTVHVAVLSGGITGKVTIEGSVAAQNVLVLAFDDHGYYVNSSEVQTSDGMFSINDLAPGPYYVMTMSQDYVDELYDNIPAPLSNPELWRTATQVQVQDGQIKENINFDLQSAAIVQGRVFAGNGTQPISVDKVRMVLADIRTGLPVMEQDVSLSDGYYRLMVPMTGSFKLLAIVNNYGRTWYPNKTDVAAAEVITIADYKSVVSNINFAMQLPAVVIETGSLSGSIKGKGQFFGALAGIVFVFNAKDTSFAGIGLGLLGSYKVENLPVGDYFVFADDYFGNFVDGFGNFVGEFYEDAYSVKQAKPVPVKADLPTEDVDFILEQGGTVSGRALSESGQSLDSLMVIAVNPQILTAESSEPFLSTLKIAACVTDAGGRYKMEGLPTGSYLIRTFSNFTLSIVLESPFFVIGDGKHNGQVVDAYYKNIGNLLNYKQATAVQVTARSETKNVDFHLQKAKYFSGLVTDAASGVAVPGVAIVAIEDSSMNLYPALASSDKDGAYRLGPLPNGRFKLLALTGLSGKDAHLAEYYDAGRELSTAQVLTLEGADVADIHFTLDMGATIQGFIDIAGGTPAYFAGADTLDGFPVLIYNADTGDNVGYDFVQFNGGYRVERLLPGNYKVLALPITDLFAATYYGGGATFDDSKSRTAKVDYGQVLDVNIELAQATGLISGKITAADTQKPLTGALAIAYDPTGHPVGVGMADSDILQADPASFQGLYRIAGLRMGSYYLRSYALSANISLVEQILTLIGGLLADSTTLDPLSLLSGDFLGQLNFKFLVYQDQWHKNLAISEKLDLEELVMKVSSHGIAGEYDQTLFPIYLPLPFYSQPPKSATMISLGDGAVVNDVNFSLLPTNATDWATGVEEQKSMPTTFMVSPNHPNPFNPETILSFSMERQGRVNVIIYDALGRRIAVLADRVFNMGSHQLRWNGRDDAGRPVASGLYMAVFHSETDTRTVKMVLMK